jgi:hypothetical protein
LLHPASPGGPSRMHKLLHCSFLGEKLANR